MEMTSTEYYCIFCKQSIVKKNPKHMQKHNTNTKSHLWFVLLKQLFISVHV
jgi:hypothetical protein